MSQSPPRPIDDVDLASCDQEPIHLLGAVQSFGFLLSLNADWVVVRASENVHQFIGLEHGQIVGRAVQHCIAAETLHDIRGRLQQAAGPGVVERLFGYRLTPDGMPFDIAVHQSGAEFVLEFEPAEDQPNADLATFRTISARLERHKSPGDLCRDAAQHVRALTGFDRVMVYRFDVDGAGEVVAEAVRNGLPSLLGLRYPATDIPAQARALYERNILRIIADADAPPVPVTPQLSPEATQLDLSMSVLRSVSPIHLEYLRNMGVRSSMSISILRGGRLWGLIACHHDAPYRVGFQRRSLAELFGQMFSYLLEARIREEEGAHDERTREIHHRIASAFTGPDASFKNVPDALAAITDYIAADGIGAYHAGEITLTGLTPTKGEFLQLVRFLNKTASGRVYSTHCLMEVFPPAGDYVMRAAGLLSVPISRTPRDYLVFFRRELARTVTWAGEPAKTEMHGPNGVRLTPRKSFEAWREIVRNQSERWTDRDMRAAEALRVTLIELVLRVTDAAHAERIGAEQRSELLIAELNHRVRNILGLVRGIITQSAVQGEDTATFVDALADRIQSLARAYDLLSITQWKPASLRDLLFTEIDAFDFSHGQFEIVGPDVMLRPKAFSAMALVCHELVINARKHGALTTSAGKITVETAADPVGNVTVAWRESGGPPVTSPTRRGFGTTILEKVIPFEVDGTSTPRFSPGGFALDILLPASAAERSSGSHARENSLAETTAAGGITSFAALLDTTLIVEDNLFIALDAEDILRKLGAVRVDIAKSVAEALALTSKGTYSFALLDVNLGAENSLPVARVLSAKDTPFVFGTGYDEAHSLDATLASIPAVSKPYHPANFAHVLSRFVVGAADGSRS